MPEKIKILSTNLENPLVVRIIDSFEDPDDISEACCCRLIQQTACNVKPCGAIISDSNGKVASTVKYPLVIINDLSSIVPGDVVYIEPRFKRLMVLYKKNGNSNALYVTDRCNSHCIMCPQPPKEEDSVRVNEILHLIDCIPNPLTYMGITGGEPTILNQDFLSILQKLNEKNPEIELHVLSNARLCKNASFVRRIRSVAPMRTSFGVPLYSSNPDQHDYIVQSKGAFDETIDGILNLAKFGFGVEIRIVLHKSTYKDLVTLSEYIYNKLPFVSHVAYMGMEHMGFVKKNWDQLWIEPNEYQSQLYEAIRYLHIRGLNCSIYNLPYCLTRKELWPFLAKSISDFKVGFSEVCGDCCLIHQCGGLFYYQKDKMNVKAIQSF